MEYTRQLKRGKSGDDVLYMKKRLVELGYLYAATKKTFGGDTYKAVKAFQAANDLEIDGVVGPLTWAALFSNVESCDSENEEEKEQAPVEAVKIPDWYGEEAKVAIGRDLASVSEERRKVCLKALEWAIDPLHPTATLKGFYIRAGKAYGTDLKPNLMTKEKLDKYFKKSSYSQYFDNGRKEMMLDQAAKDNYDKIGCDCSGFVCGIWRITKVVSSGFAACANTLYNSKCVKRSGNPIPGDLAWKSGHIGIYVGGGYVVESVGGAYGIQLTKTSKRQVYNYVKKKLEKMNGWTHFGDPKAYA